MGEVETLSVGSCRGRPALPGLLRQAPAGWARREAVRRVGFKMPPYLCFSNQISLTLGERIAKRHVALRGRTVYHRASGSSETLAASSSRRDLSHG
jgi:predicted nicotinamide N-methyase